MKKKYLNTFMTIVSAIYLVFFIVVLIKSKITNNQFDFLDADGLTIIGSVCALAELVISNRNAVSKKINSWIFYNKEVNYQIMVTLETSTLGIKEIIEELENCISNFLNIQELRRKPNSNLMSSIWNVSYDSIGCEINCSLHYSNRENSSKMLDLKISGHSKYGKINSRKKDILYLASLVKILGNYYFSSSKMSQNVKVEKIDIIIKREGSQISTSSLFSEVIRDVEDFHIKTLCGINKDEEIIINEQEIKWSTLDSRTLIDGYEYFTDILCEIE